jgi:hypothetical protein
MDAFDCFDLECARIRELDRQEFAWNSEAMLAQYMRRNAFGLDLDTKLHRITKSEWLEQDLASNRLTLPRASPAIMDDWLENPLADVVGRDAETGAKIHYGSTVQSFHALCWTSRKESTEADWANFSRGKPATRISTSVRKLLERIMLNSDSNYMHRVWLAEVDYRKPHDIRAMKKPQEVIDRLEPTGALLAYSAATVQWKYRSEDEIRLLYDVGLAPLPVGVSLDPDRRLVRVPFDWSGFIEKREDRTKTS